MESKYISRVLSHIKNKNRRRAVDAELSDHLEEKEKEYLDLGYEADGALAIAETAMGDADIVGEQFDELLKSRTKSTVIGYAYSGVTLLSAAAVCIAVSLMTQSGGSYSSSFAVENTVHQFSLLAAALEASVFALNLIGMLLGIVKKRIANLALGFAGVAGIVIFGAVKYDYSLCYFLNRLRGMDIVGIFYRDVMITRNANTEMAVNYWLFFTFLLLFGLSLWVIIRTRRLKNNKSDLALKKVLTLLLAVIAAFSTVGCAAAVTAVCAKKESIIVGAQTDLAELEKSFIDRLDEYDALDIWDLNDGAFDLFNGYTVYDAVQPVVISAYREPHEIAAYGSSDYVSVMLDTDEYNGCWYTVTTITAKVFNPFNFTTGVWYYPLFNMSDLSCISYGADITEAPLPAKLCYYSLDDVGYEQSGTKRFIKLIYDPYEEVNLVYSYDAETGRFLLTENTEIPYDEVVTLTAEQRLALTEAINERIVNRLFGDAHPAYALYSFYPLGVYYNADYNRYRIDLAAGMALTEPQYSSQETFNEIISAVVLFRNGKCEMETLNTAVLYDPEEVVSLNSDVDMASADEEAKAILDSRTRERFNADEIRERLHAQYYQYTHNQQPPQAE